MPALSHRATGTAGPGGSTKATFRLDDALLDAMKGFVESGAAPSQTAFVEDAIREHLRRLRKRELEAAYAEAAADDSFMERMNDASQAFDGTTADGL